ncbi:hypothetical protein AURDEDRAFT_55921 [Auricularia subglabra TFB-10046 SS5]|nr:hypothetical protein AURDEDRAFT_55921 [Auricularia subglabra TFB-10046 SS5]
MFGQPQQQQQQQPQTGSIFGSQPARPGGLFGSTQPAGSTFGAAPPAGSTLFGGGQQQPAQPAAGGLFGGGQQQQQQQPAMGGLFGSTPAQPATGGLFGSTPAQPAAGGTGFFGSTPAQPAMGGGLFGASTTQQPAAGGLFGSTQPAAGTGTSGLFGGGQQQQQQPAAGGLFGGGAAPTTGTPGLFGSTTTQPAATGGLFGSTTTPAGGTGFFGSSTTQPAPSGGGLFGAAAPAAGGSMFGQPQQQQAQPQSTLFAHPTAQQPQPQPQPASSFFGNTSAPSTGLFSSTSASSFRPAASGVDPGAQQVLLVRQMEDIFKAWNAQSPECAFQHFFYNLVDPAQAPLYRRPDNWTNTALWERALRENPDPTCMVPVLALGFDDLQRRVVAQDKTQAEHEAKLKELSTRLEALSQKHVLSNAVRAARARTLQAQLSARLIKLVQHLHLLIPSVRSSAIRPEEEALRAALEAVEDELTRPGGMGRVRGKLNELWALVSAVNAQHERERRARPDGPGWAVADQEGLQRIQQVRPPFVALSAGVDTNIFAQILKEQQHGLAHVIGILKQDERDVAIMQTGGTAANLPSNASFTASQNSFAASQMLRR